MAKASEVIESNCTELQRGHSAPRATSLDTCTALRDPRATSLDTRTALRDSLTTGRLQLEGKLRRQSQTLLRTN